MSIYTHLSFTLWNVRIYFFSQNKKIKHESNASQATSMKLPNWAKKSHEIDKKKDAKTNTFESHEDRNQLFKI